MKKVLLAGVVALATGSAVAQSAFEGFYGQLGIGYENNSISSTNGRISGGSSPGSISIGSGSNGSFSGVIGLGYNFQVANQFLLGLGADYGFVPSSTFNTSASSTGDVAGYKVSNRYNIIVAPGYAIDKNKLAYLKAGYSSQSLKSTDNTPLSSSQGSTFGNGNASGYVVGLGYKQMIDKGLYGFGEANYFSYSGASFSSSPLKDGSTMNNYSPKSSAYQFLVGVGYKF